MHKFKELIVWQKAVDLAITIYQITKRFPSEEKFGLTSQINRSAVSVPSNIAEGAGRNTDGEFSPFLGISSGSSFELETQLVIANRVKLITEQDFQKTSSQIHDIQSMIYGLQQSLNTN